jgi:hypothetical protein
VHRPSLINSNPQRKLLIHFELQKRRYYIQLDRIEKVSTFSRRDLSEELPDNEAACQRATSSLGGACLKTTACFGPVRNGVRSD